MMPFAQGVEEARYQVEQAMKGGTNSSNNVGDELDPEKEKEIVDCNDGDDEMHPDFLQVNPDDFEFQDNSLQVKKTIRQMKTKLLMKFCKIQEILIDSKKRPYMLLLDLLCDDCKKRDYSLSQTTLSYGPWWCRKW